MCLQREKGVELGSNVERIGVRTGSRRDQYWDGGRQLRKKRKFWEKKGSENWKEWVKNSERRGWVLGEKWVRTGREGVETGGEGVGPGR